MAGRGPRTYGRKKSAANISQFDRLISEASNKAHHPVAAKTAGHIGKWGMTSFTSIRSINGTLGKEDSLKRGSSSEDSDSKIETKVICPVVKRRKFFKSRDAGVMNTAVNETGSKLASLPNPLIHDFSTHVFNSKDANEDSLSPKICKDAGNKPNCTASGGIKLKIFKSRNTGADIYSPDVYCSSIQLASDDSSNSSLVSDSSGTNANSHEKTSNIDQPIGQINLTESKKTVINAESSINPSLDSNLDFESYSENKSSSIDAPSSLRDHSSPLFSLSEDIKDCDTVDVESNNTCNKNSPSVNLINDVAVNLFSSDFDEDEIVDRTSIDYHGTDSNSYTGNSAEPDNFLTKDSVSVNNDTESVINKGQNCYSNKESSSLFNELPPLSRSNTLDVNALQASGSTSECLITKSLSEGDTSLFKKRSIFKSRQKDDEPKKRATYTHKWHGHEEKEKKESIKPSVTLSDDPFGFDGSLTKVSTKTLSSYKSGIEFDEEDISTSIKCPKQAKKYYTVIKNVLKTHQLQESGEFQEFNDDVDYFLDALRNSNKIATRCLASLNLAQKSMVPAFRMHLRAHATVTKFFRALLDAPNHPHLAPCAAMVMFALSQDRLNMDLDRQSLELMLNLLDTDSTLMDDIVSSMDGAEHIAKIKVLCQELQLQGHAKHLKLNKINAANLAMETLLSLTSKRAGEWFKEELRQLGGIDHLVRTVSSNTNSIKADMISWTSSHIDKLSRIDRCLKVLENVTHQNTSNQEYLLYMEKGEFSKILMRLFWICHQQILLNPHSVASKLDLPVAKTLIATLITTMKVLINLTHGTKNEAIGSKILGLDDEIYSLTLSCLLKMPQYLNHDSKFEIQVLSCCLLLNLVEKSETNRGRLMILDSPIHENNSELDNISLFGESNVEHPSSISSLVSFFYSSEESAREQEMHTDNIIDKDLDQNSKEEEKKDEDIEDTVARLLQKAGRHMEDTLLAAYTALIAGYCLLDNKEYEAKIRSLQPEGNFKTMVAVLKKFLHFMNLTATTSLLRSLKPTEQVVTYMENLDKEPVVKSPEKEEMDSCFDDAFGF